MARAVTLWLNLPTAAVIVIAIGVFLIVVAALLALTARLSDQRDAIGAGRRQVEDALAETIAEGREKVLGDVFI